jgi:hypothetical protein
MTVPSDIPPIPRVWTFGSGVEIRAAREPVIFIRGAEPRAEKPVTLAFNTSDFRFR